ncbi:hypothetical protein H70357_10580 [Paenibacillus sp. FSL H7-0357]|uniref:hypothetical protein n=1 Tax=Paenibacillus sp. FSL H7-0357 TaxID=1536774 RepID=UPI0004F90024|nr:hypothetical protein [Paenibacillus sp. FSL H7-0357]AIQ17055.1 hypothetical protein H70357_10580 [Paenibacillus sp. FSL H7-0357]
MAMVWEQGELFPSANKADIVATKMLLRKYPKMAGIVNDLKGRSELTAEEAATLKKWTPIILNIELAIKAITDAEIREIMKYRFVDLHPRKAAVIKWSAFTGRSLDRKILEGTESVAGTLKLLGII